MTLGQDVPATPPTVAEVITALQRFDPELPVLVSTGYDNDTEHTSEFAVCLGDFHPEGDGNIWAMVPADPFDPDDDPDEGQIRAVMISG